MSGYLRRLVTAAMHPPRAIHAVVGSVYAPHRPAAAAALEGLSVSSEAAGEVPAPATAREGLTLTSEPAGELPAPGNRPAGRAAHRQDGAPEPTGLEADTFEADDPPLVVEREHEPRSLWPRRAEPGEPAADRTAATGHDRRAGWLPRSEERDPNLAISSSKQAETTTSARIEYVQLIDMQANASHPDRGTSIEAQPLIEMQRISAESSGPRAVPSTIRPQSAGVLRPAGPLPRAERAHEPDEIQIHIGRIDVTAVTPPAATRPAARPERKSVNLDEYLKQRRGGNR